VGFHAANQWPVHALDDLQILFCGLESPLRRAEAIDKTFEKMVADTRHSFQKKPGQERFRLTGILNWDGLRRAPAAIVIFKMVQPGARCDFPTIFRHGHFFERCQASRMGLAT
jgi:hypothetical protein